ncbi:MAG TPA: ParB/RepB/Spo0J family partition protein [Acidimicrobiales bacterium]|nr:ParB/RepB/Spo0J family partition protein [Acidimicrobiales bacterium]
MARRSGLGRGLGALIPTEIANEGNSALLELPIGSVSPSNFQPRHHFDEEALASLTASVRELGVLQPVLVRPASSDGTYELIAGERRWRAAKRAGLQSIPAIVRPATDVASLEQALVENVQRQDLNALEEAAAYQQLIEDFHLTHDEVAARVGKSRSAVSNALRLFQLPPGIQRLVAEGQLSAGHARALLGTPDRGFQESLAKKAVADGLSVREVEDAVRRRNELSGQLGGVPGATAGPKPGATGRLRPPGLLELEDLLSTYLDTSVKVEMGAKKGRLVVNFATLEDLERIYRAMTDPGSGHPTGS